MKHVKKITIIAFYTFFQNPEKPQSAEEPHAALEPHVAPLDPLKNVLLKLDRLHGH